MGTPIYYTGIRQGSEEWLSLRAGKLTASHGAVIMGGLETSGLASYVKDMAWERVYGPIRDAFQSAAMERGNEVEAQACAWYALETGAELEQIGFVGHESIPEVGWSPDALFANRKRAIEVKCPLHKAWMEVKRTGKVPSEYRWQCRFGAWIGQLEQIDFVCYHPQVGGLIVPCTVTVEECAQMAERVAIVEERVREWIKIIAADAPRYVPPRPTSTPYDDPTVVF